MVKDLLVHNIDGHVIYFCDEASRIAKHEGTDKHRLVVGMPVVSVKIGDHCYHGLCDLGASVSVIPFSLYQEIKDEIAPAEIEGIDVTIKLANRDTITPNGVGIFLGDLLIRTLGERWRSMEAGGGLSWRTEALKLGTAG